MLSKTFDQQNKQTSRVGCFYGLDYRLNIEKLIQYHTYCWRSYIKCSGLYDKLVA